MSPSTSKTSEMYCCCSGSSLLPLEKSLNVCVGDILQDLACLWNKTLQIFWGFIEAEATHTCCYLSPSSLQCRVQIKAADIAAIALTGSCPIPLASEFKGYSSIPLQGCTPCIWHAQNKPNHLLLPSSRGLFGVTCSLPAGFDDSAPALEMDTVLLACGVYVSTQ